jgi:sulfotransferase famil protein
MVPRMHEFETFVYIDVQKTGSTFISELLERFCSEKEVRYRKHGRAQRKYDPSKFYFISVRDPLDQYLSLYSHGCGGNGGLFMRLTNLGRGDLYDSTWEGFRRWLKFVLREDNAELLDDNYGVHGNGDIRKLMGLQTYRFLEMALLDAKETLDACKTEDDVRKAYAEKKMASHLIRYETFRADLEHLITTKLRDSFKDLDGALQFVREGPKVNASERIDQFLDDPKIGPKNRKMLNQREWFMHEEFGY